MIFRLSRWQADLLLLVTALIWGSGFIAQKTSVGQIGSLSFVGARFLLSALAVLPFVWLELRKKPLPLQPYHWRLGLTIGLCLTLGSYFQQKGLETTTATNAGFLTSIYVVLVPVIARLILKHRLRLTVLLACGLSLCGAWLLSEPKLGGQQIQGDLFILFADFFWATAITLVPLFLRDARRPFLLSFIQYLVAAVAGLIGGYWLENLEWLQLQAAGFSILYAGLVAGALAFTLQIIAQERTPPSEAALIMSLECVVAAFCGWLLLGETLSSKGVLGCLLILSSVLLVEAQAFIKGKT